MADSIKIPGQGDGQSIPAALAAKPGPKKARAKITKVVASAIPVPAPAPRPVVAAVVPEPVPVPEPGPVELTPAPTAAIAAPEPEPVVVSEPIAEVMEPAPGSTPPAAVPAEPQKESIMATTIENMNTATTDKAQAFFADASERTKGAVAKSTKLFEEASAFGKGNVEALVESSKIAAKGFETMGQDVAEYSRKQFQEATAAFKTLASVKSPTEFMKLQSDFMRSAFDSMVAETSRSTETVLKLAGEVVQPISNRMAVAAEKMKTPA